MARYFNFNYNFFGQNRQEGVLLIEAVLCVSILLICGIALLHLQGACVWSLQKSAQRLHVAACARRQLYEFEQVSCIRGCRIERHHYKQEGLVWTVVHNRWEEAAVSLVSVAPAA